MSEETKSEKKWAHGDVVYVRAKVVDECKGNYVRVSVRIAADPSRLADIIVEPGALIDPDALAAELAGPVARERDEARAELEAIRFILNADSEGLSAKAAVEKFADLAARVARDGSAAAALVNALRAELTTTRDDLQRTTAAMWEPLRGVAKVLGYHRASAPDFGEVDEVAVRELAERERKNSQRHLDDLQETSRRMHAAIWKNLVNERRIAHAERVIGRQLIDAELADAAGADAAGADAVEVGW